jgi:lysosomal alpha-mannosidase
MIEMYWAPNGFGWDTFQDDAPFISDRFVEDFNAEKLTHKLFNIMKDWKTHYRTNHILIPMGGDFSYTNAGQYFWGMDNMIKYINDNYYYNTTIMYSTPGNYLDAIVKSNVTFPTRYADMFPYADHMDDYWTGYFSSRANSKKQIRDGQANLHASNKLYGLKVID